MTRSWIGSVGLALVLVSCTEEDPQFQRKNNGGEDEGQGTDPGANAPPGAGDPTQPGSCAVGKPHVGFGNTDFAADRETGGLGADRRRVKPYSALRTEFQRVLGQVPTQLTVAAPAYGDAPARWFSEPTAGAVSLYTTYSIAFSGCYDTMTDPKYAAAPTAATADTECKALQRKFWQRSPTPEEVTACVTLATTDLATETVPRRRWAHACASLMTAAGFTTY